MPCTYFCIVNFTEDSEERYILLQDSDDRSICAWDSKADALDYWENGYKKAHARSYEGSMSACVNYIFFRPSIIEIDGEPNSEALVHFGVTPNSDCIEISNISGRIMEVVLDPKLGKKLWENGTRPKLIG